MNPYYFETVVVGVGNTILSGRSAGVHAARMLMRDRRLLPGVAILGGGTLGLELLGSIVDARRILFLDAVHCGTAPGTVIRVSGGELLDTETERSVHQVGIAALLSVLALVSRDSPEAVLLGLQIAGHGWGRRPLRAKAAVAPLVDEAINQLRAWQLAPQSHSRCLSARS
jgi:hydrogenase maturation protease